MTVMTAIRRKKAPRLATAQQQRGVVLLVILLVTITFGGYFGVRALNASVARSSIDNHDAEKILAQAKSALLAWSVMTIDDPLSSSYPIPTTPQVGLRPFRPGNLPYPDVAAGTSLTTTNVTPSDGERDQGCATHFWTNPATLTLRPVAASLTTAQKNSVRCFGRLPLKTLGLERLAETSSDVSGRWPWYIVSANLVSTRNDCPARLDSTMTDTTLPAGSNNCGAGFTTTAPFPWITVRDPYGAVISSRVAAVVILPGPVTSRQPGAVMQTRSITALPTAYLDTVDNPACPGGRCDNALLNTAPLLSPNTTPMTFIQCVPPSSTVGDARFNVNYACNDRLIYITVDELFNHAAKRIEREFVSCLKEYFEIVNLGKYPWPAQPGDPGVSLPGTLPLTGSFPSIDETAATTCPKAQAMFSAASYWGGWQRAASYTLNAGQTSARFSFSTLAGRVPVSLP